MNSHNDVHDKQRSGRPSLISEDPLQETEGEIRANRRVTIRESHHIIPEVSKTTIHESVTEKLGYRKLCACWVPKMLTDDHKTKRMGSALKFLTHYAHEGDEFLDSTVTGDETWVFHHTPESKQRSLKWRHTHSPRTKKFKTSISKKKSWRPFCGTEKAFSWSTSWLLAQQLMPLHIVTT